MASAPSVPGRIGMCQSACRAVRVRTGSMTTILAPLSLRALSRNGQPCRFVLVMFMPQTMMYFEYAIDSMSSPPVPPTVMCQAVEEPDSQ
ncbi:hypothetical protein GCM10023215_00010 [Pseudonocardia yuanmonensis]|uniref:Uncharacterized protein n=1 Tax=Pseudonocardia yuanmonensis TaxID=1095914 RepID=A0ABP8VV38_9PSEU